MAIYGPFSLPNAWPDVAGFEAALLDGRRSEALGVMNAFLDTGRDLIEFEMRVVTPALYAIGEKWQNNIVSVAAEHLATAIAQSVMTQGLLRAPIEDALGKRVLLACVQGNDHAVGLRMVADAFEIAGWDVQYLGANVPSDALVQQVLQWAPDLVAISIAFPSQLPAVEKVVERLAQRSGNGPAVIVGGLLMNAYGGRGDLTRADAYAADPQEAVAYGSRLTKTRS